MTPAADDNSDAERVKRLESRVQHLEYLMSVLHLVSCDQTQWRLQSYLAANEAGEGPRE